MRGSPGREAGREAGPDAGHSAGRSTGQSRWHWLLVIFVLVPLATPWFNKVEPRLLGFPFFYWGQLSLIAVVSVGTLTVYLLAKWSR
jgi:Protein of unknown function (DUF3311)